MNPITIVEGLQTQGIPAKQVYGRFALLWIASRPEIQINNEPLMDLEGKNVRYLQMTAQAALMSIAYGGTPTDNELTRRLKKAAHLAKHTLQHKKTTLVGFWDYVDTLQMAWSQARRRNPPLTSEVRMMIQLSSPTKWALAKPTDAIIHENKEGVLVDDRYLKRLRGKKLDIDLDVQAHELSLYLTK